MENETRLTKNCGIRRSIPSCRILGYQYRRRRTLQYRVKQYRRVSMSTVIIVNTDDDKYNKTLVGRAHEQ